MALTLTPEALGKADQAHKTPNIVLEIDGVSTTFGAVSVEEIITIGCPDLVIGEPLPGETEVWTIGGLKPIPGQEKLINLARTSNTIKQVLKQDKGTGESISALSIAVVDKDGIVSNIISPGKVVEDIMSRKCRVWLGFEDTAYPGDYVIVFRGVIQQVQSGSGLVVFDIAHPDIKKKSTIFEAATTNLDGAITAGSPSTGSPLTVNSTSDFLAPVIGPDTTEDGSILFYVRIDNEIIQYTSKAATTFVDITRGALGTTAASHDDDAEITSFYRLTGNAIDLALKLMSSGFNGPFIEDEPVTNFVNVGTGTVANSIFFNGVDLNTEYGLTVGDYITTTGASNGANNVTLKAINGIISLDDGDYITVDGVTFVEENDTSAVIDFRSRFDTLGEGLKMSPDFIDIQQHLDVQSRFLSSVSYDFYLREDINGKEFISNEIFKPAAAVSIPRKARSSIGYHIGPLPFDKIKTLSQDNVLNPDKIQLIRSTAKNFYNTVAFSFDEDTLEEKFLTRDVPFSATSRTRIPIGNKTLQIKAKGVRSSLDATGIVTTTSNRLLKKYKFGAEFFKDVKVNLKTGIDIEIDDIVLLDLPGLQITDINTGDRNGDLRLFQVINKTLNLKTGVVSFALMDPNFDKDQRYGLISPASLVNVGVSGTEFTIKASFNTDRFGINEFKKWEPYVVAGTAVKVRNDDFSVSGTSVIDSIVGNTIFLASALGFTPLVDYVMELDEFDNAPTEITTRYTFMSDVVFADGSVQYKMI